MVTLVAAALIAAVSQQWQFNDNVSAREPTCGIGLQYVDGTSLTFGVSQTTWRDKVFLLTLHNSSWSIEDGEQLGDIVVSSATFHIGSHAVGANHGFYMVGDIEALHRLLKTVDASGFSVVRPSKTQEIGNYAAGDVAAVLPKFDRCLKAKFAGPDDPFAK